MANKSLELKQIVTGKHVSRTIKGAWSQHFRQACLYLYITSCEHRIDRATVFSVSFIDKSQPQSKQG